MATSAAAIAAAVARARRELIEYLEQRGAYDPAHAVTLEFPSNLHERQLDVLVGKGVVKQTMEGRYWFDREAFELDRERQAEAAKRMLIIVAALIAVVVAVAAIIERMKQG